MNDSDSAKARQYPRVHAESIISIRPLSSPEDSGTLTTSKVLGLGGIMFETSQPVRKGQKLEITLLAGTELVKIGVRVVWTRKIDAESRRVGVEFQDVTEESRVKILDHLMRRVYLEEEIGG